MSTLQWNRIATATFNNRQQSFIKYHFGLPDQTVLRGTGRTDITSVGFSVIETATAAAHVRQMGQYNDEWSLQACLHRPYYLHEATRTRTNNNNNNSNKEGILQSGLISGRDRSERNTENTKQERRSERRPEQEIDLRV